MLGDFGRLAQRGIHGAPGVNEVTKSAQERAKRMQRISRIQGHSALTLLLSSLVTMASFLTNDISFAQRRKTVACDEFASFKGLSAKTVEAHVVKKADLSGPILGTISAHADISVRVFVDQHGSVVCAKAIRQGNPVLRSLAEDTAMKWKFTPFRRRNKAIPFQGIVVFHVDL